MNINKQLPTTKNNYNYKLLKMSICLIIMKYGANMKTDMQTQDFKSNHGSQTSNKHNGIIIKQ